MNTFKGTPGPWTVGRFITSSGSQSWTIGRTNPNHAGLREPLLGKDLNRRKWSTQAAAQAVADSLNALREGGAL